MPHANVWFWNTGLQDPAWVQAFAAVAVAFMSLATLIVLAIYATDTHTQAKASVRSANAAVTAANAAETAANAAHAQTQLMISKERARHLVSPDEKSNLMMALTANQPMGRHEFTLINIGLTPAINVLVCYRAIANGFETHPVGNANRPAIVQHIIPANKEADATLVIDPYLVSAETHTALYVHVWGKVTYNDVLSSEQRITTFGFRTQMTMVNNQVANQMGLWTKSDNPEDNIAT